MATVSAEKIDLSEAINVLLDVLEKVRALDGMQVPIAMSSRDRGAFVAPIRSELLYLRHMLDVAGVELMDVYHTQLRNIAANEKEK